MAHFSAAASRRSHMRSTSTSTRNTSRSRLRQKSIEAPVPVKSPYLQNRTLVYSATGTGSTDPKSCLKSPRSNSKTRTKSVHYDKDDKRATVIDEFDLRGKQDKHPCRIVCAVYLDNDKLVVADQGNNNLKLFDDESDLDGSIGIQASHVALCESRISSSELYASADNLIYKIDTSSEFIIIDTIETEVVKIEGIASWDSGIAIVFKAVTSSRDDKGHFEIHLLDFAGEVHIQMTLASQYAVRLMTPIWYTASIDNGTQMMLSDTQNNRILCIDLMNWHINYVIKGKEKGGLPRSLCMDADENILAVWYDEIHKLSKTGTNLGIPIQAIDRKSVIAYNKNRQQLAVMSWSRMNVDKFCLYQM